jgi:hypothetical protein
VQLHFVTLLLGIFFVAASSSSLYLFHQVIAVDDEDYDKDDQDKNDDNGEDFEEESSIQICCTWGRDFADGVLTYYIDDDDSSEEQQQAVRNAVEEWDTKVNPLELDEASNKKISDIRIEFQDDEDDEIAGQTMDMFDGYGFIDNAEITISKGIYDYKFDTAAIEQIAKHEMGHALGLGHANFDGNLMAERIKDGTETISECEIRAVVEANQWRLSGGGGDNTNPYYPQDDSVSCKLE